MANHYIRDGATGTADGSDWTNAWDDMPTSWTRGDTYYVAGGTYSGRTYNTALSGTTLTTIQGATVADHGTATGWNAAYAVETNEAHFASSAVSTGYWTFDGAVGSGNTSSSYGFVMDAPASGTHHAITIGAGSAESVHNLTFRHFYAQAIDSDVEREFLYCNSDIVTANNYTVEYCYFDHWQGVIMFGTANAHTGFLFQYNYVYRGWSSFTHHGEDINSNGAGYDGIVIRYNVFDSRSGGTGVIQANNGPINNAKIYANLFMDNSPGNGIIAGCDSGMTGPEGIFDTVVYNNTFVRCTGGAWFDGHLGGGTGNVAYNNLFYDMSASHGTGLDTHDYNAYFSCDNAPEEAHGQISAAGDPFVNALSDYHLSTATDDGKDDIGAEYATDLDGETRDADGVWDRGAYEYDAGGPGAYNVIYVANGATSGSVPEDATDYAETDPVTVLGNTGGLSRGLFWDLICWNTQADGEGDDYLPGSTLTMPESNVTLYAKWRLKCLLAGA